jgi:hypothetical protein
MHATTPIDGDATPQKCACRFRFSLKWLLILIASLSILLAIYTTRERKSREMVALNDNISNAIEENVRKEPPNTKFLQPESFRRRIADFMKGARSKNYQRRGLAERVFGGGSLFAHSSYNTNLDVTNALAAPNGSYTPVQLLSHYANSLAELGLKQTVINSSPYTAAAMWELPEHGVSVIIDVILDAAAKDARVRIIFIQNDRISIW